MMFVGFHKRHHPEQTTQDTYTRHKVQNAKPTSRNIPYRSVFISGCSARGVGLCWLFLGAIVGGSARFRFPVPCPAGSRLTGARTSDALGVHAPGALCCTGCGGILVGPTRMLRLPGRTAAGTGGIEVVAAPLGLLLTRWNCRDGGRARRVSKGCNPRPVAGILLVRGGRVRV